MGAWLAILLCCALGAVACLAGGALAVRVLRGRAPRPRRVRRVPVLPLPTCRCAIQALQQAQPQLEVHVFCRSGLTAEGLRESALQRFNVKLPRLFQVHAVEGVELLLPARYPRLTLVGQAWGSVRWTWHCLRGFVPEVFVDTTGLAFTYPLACALGCRVACYTHYPTVSTDMLRSVLSRRAAFNNTGAIANSSLLSTAKLAYYAAFAAAYGVAGACCQVVMVNSSWTRGHIERLWFWRRAGVPQGEATTVFPPCDAAVLAALPLDRRCKRLVFISVGQFRPEKNHALQLTALAAARRLAAGAGAASLVEGAVLQIVGSTRGPEDEARLAQLRQLAQDLGLGAHVEFRVNVPFRDLVALLGEAVGGLHTMRDEHFGISVVEYMAAGVVPIAHNSGGPRADIVAPLPGPSGDPPGDPCGFLCETEREYAAAIVDLLHMSQAARLKLAAAGRRRAARFTDQAFQEGFLRCLGYA